MQSSFSYPDTCFYTDDHEWIFFEGIVAQVGVCPFKLAGISKINKIEFNELSVKMERGKCLATIFADEYEIKIHMPVDGWVIEKNTTILSDPSVIRQGTRSGWIAKIRPVAPYSREGLLQVDQYKPKIKKKASV